MRLVNNEYKNDADKQKLFSYCNLIFLKRIIVCLLLMSSGKSIFALDKINLQLKYLHQFQFAGYYAALEKGYYANAGLDVNITESFNGNPVVENVLSRKVQFGVGSSSLLLERNAGKPLVVVAVIFQHSPYVLLTPSRGATQTIHDIAGRTIMLAAQSEELIAYLKKEGINIDSLTKEKHSFNPDDLINGKVYGFSAYVTNEPDYLDKAHFAYNAYSPRSAGIDFYGDNLFTSEGEIKEHPSRVKAFREASILGWQYAMTHQEEIIDLILSKYSKRNHREHLQYEAKQMMALLQPVLVEMGYMNPGRWKHIGEVYSELGMLPKNFTLEGFLYEPNPPPDLSWFYGSIGIFIFVTIFVWHMQTKRLNKERLITQAESAENRRLATENRLLQSEKLAALGQLAAGMTHELNTPLGAILSSNQAILDILHNELNHIPSILASLDEEDMNRFNIMLEESLKHSPVSDGFPDRAIKKNLVQSFREAGIKNSENIASIVIDAGIYQLGDRLVYLLSSNKCTDILSVVYSFSMIFHLSNIISVATGKASHVVGALKSYLNPNGKGNEDNNSEIDIKSEIETILTLYQNKIKYAVEVIQTYQTNEKCIGNRDKLNQVWINLLNNGLQAMSYKGKLEIRTELNKSWIVVSFIDSGIGIPKEIQDKIFDPFFTTKKHGEGIGIGLDICKKIITNIGGKIEFESYPGRTQFSVWLKSAGTI
ncbi:MAG: ABC transporter substrate-binding protein [Leptospiraceae bacterium]|nr:ABC transporter substrate-binding protein [Leptospiraceae bacterium]